MPPPSLVMQTTYAELLERCAAAAFGAAFPEDGVFTSKTIKERRYWYFQAGTEKGRTQKYAGAETPELLEQIARHKEARDDERERRGLVSTLVRSFGLPRPIPQIGGIVAGLADAGVFRLRGVLVGTVAYQTYSAMLGVKLPIALIQTGAVDIAQFKNVSVAIKDRTPPVFDVLKKVDKAFRSIPHTSDSRRVTSYIAKGGMRVDFLTPNEGRDTDRPQKLAAFDTDAQPPRFLDYLIHEPERAVVLHKAGTYVWVPAPERYAVHKLIISNRRRAEDAKHYKDLQQAGALLETLAQSRPGELRLAWLEAHERGKVWRQLLLEGMSQLEPHSRDIMLKIIEKPRADLPGLDLTFNNPPARYDFNRDTVTFPGEALGSSVSCAISREALEDHFDADGLDQVGRVAVFLKNRSRIERIAREKYLFWPVEEPKAVLIRTEDVQKLSREIRTSRRSFVPNNGRSRDGRVTR